MGYGICVVGYANRAWYLCVVFVKELLSLSCAAYVVVTGREAMSRLLEQRMAFSTMVPELIRKALELGFRVTIGDVFRDARCLYGSKSTRHRVGLAIDLNLFRDGKYLSDTEDHAALGEWWESVGGIWGGRFEDGNHYEWPM
jgi:hypothetical protein